MKFGAVIEQFEEANVDMRDAYWGYPHRSSDGDKELVIVVDGQEFTPTSVAKEENRIVVTVGPAQ